MGVAKLKEYARKRNFNETPEPSDEDQIKNSPQHKLQYVIQKHDASHLHYDFRLEIDGVLKSWAIPKGPSIKVGEKRLAVETEDHPMEYANFEGSIPVNNYGAGQVIIWDKGSWKCNGDPSKQYKEGNISFEIKGKRLQGNWRLILMKGSDKKNWLLIKSKDKEKLKLVAPVPSEDEISIVSKKSLDDYK